MQTASVIKVIYGRAARGVLEPDLIPIDRILMRWAESVGCGLPTEIWDDTRRARVPPLDDLTATVVDQIICKLPPRTKRVINGWYRRPLPTDALAEELRMSPSSLRTAWRVCLNFLRYKFEISGNRTLRRLIKLRT